MCTPDKRKKPLELNLKAFSQRRRDSNVFIVSPHNQTVNRWNILKGEAQVKQYFKILEGFEPPEPGWKNAMKFFIKFY